jgi:hypothetical protein
MALSDFLLGDVDGVHFTTPLVVHYFQPGHSFYAMDTWKITPKLTLTYGLRYELFAPIMERKNNTTNFTPTNGGGIVTAASNASGWYARSLIHPDLNDFAPRLGFAYQMTNRIVLRGGYGVFYQHSNRIGSESLIQLNPPALLDVQLNQSGASTVFQLKNELVSISHNSNCARRIPISAPATSSKQVLVRKFRSPMTPCLPPLTWEIGAAR